jgi:hypothetical protein
VGILKREVELIALMIELLHLGGSPSAGALRLVAEPFFEVLPVV